MPHIFELDPGINHQLEGRSRSRSPRAQRRHVGLPARYSCSARTRHSRTGTSRRPWHTRESCPTYQQSVDSPRNALPPRSLNNRDIVLDEALAPGAGHRVMQRTLPNMADLIDSHGDVPESGRDRIFVDLDTAR